MADTISILKKKEWVFTLFLLLLSVLIFCIILIPREVRFLKTISVLARYNSTRFLPAVGLLLLGAFSIKNQRLAMAASALIIASSFALALNGLWAGAYSENNVIAGLIPRTDAFSFYGGAVSLVESGYLVSYAKRRPLFGGLLAFLLWITGGHLQFTLAIMAFLSAVVCFYSVLEVRKVLNTPAAILYFFVLFLFMRRFIGITMSENMGILLGVSAFTFFLIFMRSESENQRKRIFLFLSSVFLFTLAQVARPGAIATLPILILFAGWVFKNGKKISWKWMAFTAAVILLAFLANSVLFRLTTLPGGSQANNIGFGIYGLVVGGKGWEQIFIDHPELNLLSGKQFEQAVFRFIWEELRSHPQNIITGMLVQFKYLFSFSDANSLYSFLWSKNQFFSIALIGSCYLLSLSAIINAFFKKRQSLIWVLGIFGIGFLLSLPVAPAYQTRQMRVYAASLPLLAFMPAAGFSSLIGLLPEKMRSWSVFSPPSQGERRHGLVTFTALLVALILLGPLSIRLFSPDSLPTTPDCEAGEDAVVLAYYPGSSIRIYRNDPSITTWVPVLTQLDYKGSIHNICCDDVIRYFKDIPAPNLMYPGLNQLTGELMYMIVKEEQLPAEYGRLAICGRIEDVLGQRSKSGFLYPNSIQLLD